MHIFEQGLEYVDYFELDPRVIGHAWPSRNEFISQLELDPVSSAIHGLHGMSSS